MLTRVDERAFDKRRFLFRFALAAGVLLLAYYFPYGGVLAFARFTYLAVYAQLAGAAIRFFDSSVQVHGTHIAGRTSLEFATSCDAMDVLILFSAAVLAFPASRRQRAKALVCALAGVTLLNLTRVVVLYAVRVDAPAWFEALHMTFFPLVLVAASAGGFLLWAQEASRAPARA